MILGGGAPPPYHRQPRDAPALSPRHRKVTTWGKLAGYKILLGTTADGAKWIDVVTVAAQAIAEIFVSAGLGMPSGKIISELSRCATLE